MSSGSKRAAGSSVRSMSISSPVAEFVRWLCFLFVDKNVAVFDQPLQTRSRPAFDLFGKKCVEALSGDRPDRQ